MTIATEWRRLRSSLASTLSDQSLRHALWTNSIYKWTGEDIDQNGRMMRLILIYACSTLLALSYGESSVLKKK